MNQKIFLLLVFALSASLGAFAQIPTIDSLRSILPTLKGEERLTVLNEISSSLREVEQQIAFDYAVEAEGLAQSLKNKSGEAKAKENIGWIYYRRGQWQKTFYYSKAAYNLAIEGDDLEEAARVLNSMGALFYEQKNFSLSIDQFKKAYDLSSKAEDLYTMMRSLNNIAFNFKQLNELDSAMYYALKAIEINKIVGSPYLLSFSNRIVGDIYFKRNRLDSAEIAYEKALQIGESQGFSTFKASILHRLGYTLLLNGKPEQAKRILLEGVELSSRKNLLDELSKSHKNLAEYYGQIGDYKEAFKQQSIFVALNDSLAIKSNIDRLTLMQGMLQDDLDQSERELLIAQNETQATLLANNERIILLVSSGSILILGLLIWLFYLNRNIKKSNADLIFQKQQIHQQNEALELKSAQLQAINQTKNKLFSILGHDLKGPVGQVKSTVDLMIDGHLNQEEFDELIHNLKKGVDSVYFTLNNTLKWSIAQMEGFKLHKENFNLSKLLNTNIEMIMPQLKAKYLGIDDLSVSTDLEIYADRDLIEVVIRNILNNAVKFSKAGDIIHLSIEMDNNMVSLCVKDEGIGMNEKQIIKLLKGDYVISNSKLGTKREKGSGLGLQICKEFTRMNDGEIQINSKEGEGTQVCIKVPTSQVLVDN